VIFCEEERARFLSAKSAKFEGPLKWTAQQVPRPFLGLSVVFATVMSSLSKLWAALVLCCCMRTGPAKLDIAMISAGMMPFEDDPRTSQPLDDSGHGTPTRKYLVGLEKFFKRASSAGPHQTWSDRSQSKRDTHAAAAISSTPQYPRSRFESSEQVFTRAVSAGPLSSSTKSDKGRDTNATLDENQRHLTIPHSHASKKPIHSRLDHGVTFA